MIKKISAASAIAVALGAAPAAAASLLPVVIDETIAIEAPSAGLDYGFVFTTFAEGGGATVGLSPSLTALDVLVVGLDPFSAVLTVADGDDAYLTADAVERVAASSTAEDDGTDVIELLLTDVGGIFAGEFGNRVLLTYTGEFGADPLGAGGTFDAFASLVINPVTQVIPLPPAAALFATALAGLGLARRRRAVS